MFMYKLRLLRLIKQYHRANHLPKVFASALGDSRSLSTLSTSEFQKLVTKPTSKFQIYISRSRDPYTNLSIEHFLLQKSPADSTILFLYVNRPCVVIGRNQNPWLEADLRLLRNSPAQQTQENMMQKENSLEIMLVRRRSGGGTVFHDEGNVNYSVICPTADFTRDKHVGMVVQAIRKANPRARVNERHDIVIDQGDVLAEGEWPHPSDMHRTAYSSRGVPLKVSGSAYKLTRQRSLHHGTCLLASQNLDSISQYLRSPARPFMTARGVESVRSPIANIFSASGCPVENVVSAFQLEVVEAFSKMYYIGDEVMDVLSQTDSNPSSLSYDHRVVGYVNEELSNIPEIQAGIKELKVIDQGLEVFPRILLIPCDTIVSGLDLRTNPTIHTSKPYS